MVDEDDKMVMYEYSVYNWNQPEWRDTIHIFDGSIIIEKDMLHGISDEEPFALGAVEIQNCSNSWRFTSSGHDVIAVYILWKILKTYQEEGMFPKQIGYHV